MILATSPQRQQVKVKRMKPGATIPPALLDAVSLADLRFDTAVFSSLLNQTSQQREYATAVKELIDQFRYDNVTGATFACTLAKKGFPKEARVFALTILPRLSEAV